MVKLFKLSFVESTEKVHDLHNGLSEYDKTTIAKLSVIATYEYYTDGVYLIFLLMKENEIETYENILEVNNISYICKDISMDVIYNTFDIESFLKNTYESVNFRDYYIFIEDVKRWIISELNVNLILDRINLYGMSNLRELDYTILNNY